MKLHIKNCSIKREFFSELVNISKEKKDYKNDKKTKLTKDEKIMNKTKIRKDKLNKIKNNRREIDQFIKNDSKVEQKKLSTAEKKEKMSKDRFKFLSLSSCINSQTANKNRSKEVQIRTNHKKNQSLTTTDKNIKRIEKENTNISNLSQNKKNLENILKIT